MVIMWEFHDQFLFSIRPKKLKSLTRSIFIPDMSLREKSNGVSWNLWKNVFGFLHIQWKFVYCQPVIDFVNPSKKNSSWYVAAT